MKFSNDQHFSDLNCSYEQVGNKTWELDDFSSVTINRSRQLFTDESLLSRKPVPKELEVFALLSGIEFEREMTSKLIKLQEDLSTILQDSLHYWVSAENLGVEYCVFKWPDGEWHDTWVEPTNSALSSLKVSPFLFSIYGIQINADGCVIAKGYDEAASISNIRTTLKSNLDFFPEKQSRWAHVPMGRILEPVGSEKFERLRLFIANIKDQFIVASRLDSAKFVHETQWYMEEKEVLCELSFK